MGTKRTTELVRAAHVARNEAYAEYDAAAPLASRAHSTNGKRSPKYLAAKATFDAARAAFAVADAAWRALDVSAVA